MKLSPKTKLMLLLSIVVFVVGAAAPTAAMAGSGATRIRFERGATSATVSGTIGNQGEAEYVLRASAGQLMEVVLTAPAGARLEITRRNGRELTPIGEESDTSFRGYLPYSGDYYLYVIPGNNPGDYSLNVSIPVRVSFEQGTTSAQRQGHLNASQGLEFIVRASKGQLLEVSGLPEGNNGRVQLIIYGADGTVLKSGMGESSSYRGNLPSSQDYIIKIRAGENAVDYTLDVIIPQRIRFQEGAVSGSVWTWLAKDRTQYYVLAASEDQRMQVTITNNAHLELVVYGADGTVLEGISEGGAGFDSLLPSTQEYILAVTNEGQAVSYKLTVTIR